MMRFVCLLLSVLFVLSAVECANEAVIAKQYAVGELSKDNFEYIPIDDISSEDIKNGEVLLEMVGLSVDPYMRGRFRSEPIKNYFIGNFELEKPITGGGLGKVIATKNSEFEVGDYVAAGQLPWQRKAAVDPIAASLLKAPKADSVSLYYKFLFPFNIAPLSAYLPIRELWPKDTIKKGNITAYVSGAAGATGMIAGQILKKVYGFSNVIGSAGSDEKAKYLVETVGFDSAFNYKKESPYDALPRLAPNKIDYFFDNVGGDSFDAFLASASFGAKMISCGTIQTYDKEDTSVKMKFADKFAVGNEELLKWFNEGLLVTQETFVDGLENAPEAFIGLMQGKNTGKMMVRVSDIWQDQVSAASIKSEL